MLCLAPSLPTSAPSPSHLPAWHSTQGGTRTNKVPVKWADPKTEVLSRGGFLDEHDKPEKGGKDASLQEPSRGKARQARLPQFHGAQSRPDTGERAKEVRGQKEQWGRKSETQPRQ